MRSKFGRNRSVDSQLENRRVSAQGMIDRRDEEFRLDLTLHSSDIALTGIRFGHSDFRQD